MQEYFKSKIRNIQDFPKPGIVFRDITTLLKDQEAFHRAGEQLVSLSRELEINKVVGIDSRGFIYGGYLARQLEAGFVVIRKPGKLPAETLSQSYILEYGTDTLEIHRDSINPGDKILLHDDLLATGGTAKAACELIEKAGGEVVQLSFIVELSFLRGRDHFKEYDIVSLVNYDSE